MLVSAVYAVSVSKALLQPVQLSIQHCVSIETQEHTGYLSFVTADLYQPDLPYKMQLEEGGQFYTCNQYGSINLTKFSIKGIIKALMTPIRWLFGYDDIEQQETLSSLSDNDAQFVDTHTNLATYTSGGKNSFHSSI